MTKKKLFNMPLDRVTVADPGKGPGGSNPLIFGPNCGPMGKKIFLKTGPPPLSQGLDDRPPFPYLMVWIRHCVIPSQIINWW